MRLGFVSIFAWRPHAEHLHYLAGLAREAGHAVRSLVCDADLPSCYTREMHAPSPGWLECLKCRAGGLRSFESRGVASIASLHPVLPDVSQMRRFAALAQSSASTLGRYESNADYADAMFSAVAHRLAPAVALAYDATRRWLECERLDAVFLFNGRMDATRGVFEACRDAGVRPLSVERTWFGDGVQLLPDEHCLGLRSIDRLMAEWRDAPLTRSQALRGARLAASRFLRRNANEWRAYNLEARAKAWPAAGARRVLLLPSSRNEVWGSPEIEGGWGDRTCAFDLLAENLGLRADEMVLRCHPNWAERIGQVTGEHSERYYSDWARRRGVAVIGSRDSASTPALIEAADAVVVTGGTAALEAGILGKHVIALTPSIYGEAGFESRAWDEPSLRAVRLDGNDPASAGRRARLTLRFLHTMAYRVAQFVPHVRLRTTTQYEYFEGADPQRLADLARDGVLQPDDGVAATASDAEDAVLAMIAKRDWAGLLHAPVDTAATGRRVLGRRPLYAWVDALRDRLPRGDL